MLNSADCGITLDNTNYNAICYADDIILCCTTASGLQILIDKAVSYVGSQGLRFNPSKSICMIQGKNPFRTEPECIIDGQPLQIKPNITYLCAVLGGNNGPHCDSRMRSAQRAFYSIQGTGLCYKGVDAKVAINKFQTAVQTTLTYGCDNIFISRTALNRLDSF